VTGRRALILGISGQDGSYLAELLLAKGYEVWGLVRGSPERRFPNLEAIQDRLRLVHGDLRDRSGLEQLVEQSRPHELYNLASTSTVAGSWDDPLANAEETVLAVTTLLEAIRRVDPAIRFYLASSSQLFGAATESPQRETTPFRPTDPYGAAKLYAQVLIASYRERYGIHGSSGIAFNHESPRRPERYVTRKVTRAAAAISLGLEDKLVLGDLAATRDWGFAGDFVEAMWLMLQADEGSEYVLATGVSRSVRELVDAAFGGVGLDPDDHLEIDATLVRPPYEIPLVGDATKARERLGWRPATSFEEMIAAMVERDRALATG